MYGMCTADTDLTCTAISEVALELVLCVTGQELATDTPAHRFLWRKEMAEPRFKCIFCH